MKRTETKYSYEHANESWTTVEDIEYLVWDNYARRGTFAQSTMTGDTMQISMNRYISRDLTVRKAIASAFGHDSFRK